MEIIYRGETWVLKDLKEVRYRDITNLKLNEGTKKSNVKKMKINDDEMTGIISRMMYAYQVYQTKGHDLENCLCTGCKYGRNARYFLGEEIAKKLIRNW